nr:serine--tRNA ligase [Candidatus Sigynarchaeota archaeon]
MLDIKLFRENIELIKESQRKRFKDVEIVDKVMVWDQKWRDILAETEAIRARRNAISKEIGQLKKKGVDNPGLVAESKQIGLRIEENA